LTGEVWQHNLCAQKKCPSHDSDFITKFDWHKDAQFLDKLKLVTQALEIKAKAVYRRIFENPCVGGSIPALATTPLLIPHTVIRAACPVLAASRNSSAWVNRLLINLYSQYPV
jgi:hypothetical protein